MIIKLYQIKFLNYNENILHSLLFFIYLYIFRLIGGNEKIV